MFALLKKLVRRPRAGPDLTQLYEMNHIERTFGVSLAEFNDNPWRYLGAASPEIQALWGRAYRLLPDQLSVALAAQASQAEAPELQQVA